jgi:hypothetical protein
MPPPPPPESATVVPLFAERPTPRTPAIRHVREADRLARDALVDLELLAQCHAEEVIYRALRLTS